jgi:hypothetical protein
MNKKTTTDAGVSSLYRETDLRQFEVLASRQATFKQEMKRLKLAGLSQFNDCYACSCAATNAESGCSRHGIYPVAIRI